MHGSLSGSIADIWEAEKPSLMPLPTPFDGYVEQSKRVSPSALRNGAPFVEMPEAFCQLQDKLLRKPGGDREMVEILSLVMHHDEQVVLCAVDMALQAGVPTKTHVLNLLHRLVDGTPTDQPDVTPPSCLFLTKEPEANIARYDGLRGDKRHAS